MNETYYPVSIREEELKNRVAKEFFADFDSTRIIGNVDFCIAVPVEGDELFEPESLLWAEAKKGTRADILASLVQLILTIGKARTFDLHLPPAFLGAFDAEKIAFVHYNAVLDVFYQNDFNWNVTPSDHDSREFRQLYALVDDILNRNMLLFRFGSDCDELHRFIRQNLIAGKSEVSKIRINKNNFTNIYSKWLAEVKPTISVNWEVAKRHGIIDADFYLADILSEHNVTLKQKLFVLLRGDHYELDRKLNEMGLFSSQEAQFTDRQQAHTRFWNRYSRPPKRDYWDYIVERRDLLVPQDVRERKGSFFTPQRWVELSQEYLARELGDDWQDEYYIWDCCAGTGNLLAGLTNKYRIWASTLDRQDVDVMHERIRNGANLLENHVFQFDFLNDDFSKLSQSLYDVISDPDKRKKLVIYINPPYAEAGSTFSKEAKTGVSNTTKVHKDYAEGCGKYAKRELFVQFFMRIYKEIPDCILAEFSTLKILQGPYFQDFRKNFRAKLGRNFLVPADTFDNVKGQFPIGFFIWHLDKPEHFKETYSDIYDRDGNFSKQKYISSYEGAVFLNDWLRPTWKHTDNLMGYLVCNGNDFQHQNEIAILSKKGNETSTFFKPITSSNVLKSCIYLAVRHCIEATWLNDRDQFLYPNDGWETDMEFQSSCLVYALFHGQNRISSNVQCTMNNVQLTASNQSAETQNVPSARTQTAPNHWIPFTEEEVGAAECFASHFMTDFMAGKQGGHLCPEDANTVQGDLFRQDDNVSSVETQNFASLQQGSMFPCLKDVMSPAARAVMDAGREVWRYYHREAPATSQMQNTMGTSAGTQTAPYNVNASLYDIKAFFKGRDEKGRMNATSVDERFNALMEELRVTLVALAKEIETKVYEYGFLK